MLEVFGQTLRPSNVGPANQIWYLKHAAAALRLPVVNEHQSRSGPSTKNVVRCAEKNSLVSLSRRLMVTRYSSSSPTGSFHHREQQLLLPPFVRRTWKENPNLDRQHFPLEG